MPVDFLRGAISLYVTNPARRAAIGTPDELSRLLADVPAPAPVPLAERPVREHGITRSGVAIRLLLIAAAIAVDSATDAWWLKVITQAISGTIAVSLAAKFHPITWVRQRLARQGPGTES